MAIRVKVVTNLIFPLGSINPEALLGKKVEIFQLHRCDSFIVDSVEYDAEYPDRVEVGIVPAPTTNTKTLRG